MANAERFLVRAYHGNIFVLWHKNHKSITLRLQLAVSRIIVLWYHFNSTFAYVVLYSAAKAKFCVPQNRPQSRSILFHRHFVVAA